MIATVNPATGERVRTYTPHTEAEVDRRVERAVTAQSAWRHTPLVRRVELLRSIARVLRAGAEDHARLITLEMGKPLVQARAEIEKCAVTLDYYAQHAPAFLADEAVASDAADSRVVFEPLGVVLAVMPWNFPFWQFFRFAAPALAAGNAALLKHAGNVPGSALAIEQVLAAAGAPDGLVSALLVETEAVAPLIDDPRVAAVTLTGSTQAGATVAARAAARVKKQVLELGGSDPFVVLADADVQEAASAAVAARFTNAGQSCVNAKRFLVHAAVADEFVEHFTERAQALTVGDPFEPATTVGPLARPDLLAVLHDQVRRSVTAGAVLLTGGELLPGPGSYYPPTVLDRVAPGHAVFDQETFGPVAAITRVDDDNEAVRLANLTEFGLGASLWSSDPERAERLARRIDAGAVFVNGIVASDPRLPFGGVKASGYGRELGSYGIREFVNVKTLWIGSRQGKEAA
ncbi:NAD-dependent succinate-semialdehyde dehydrogenase [Streptomyces sp. 8L]|uniref:NAD-dependent succinate-semialdehyde dehydrogenase n=1 Tax=Streptomyces sp. 8L TaxID=2877242 RepID=UPI001CD7F977|nr:NAD-dependent succinate-semialdehyde dehydrogenase [Streptomyces sp. 8L]MCA1216951.1 NAD-dependent succinate-semialdehyde dehydrogenase [Streptomyces sp. 8L]